MDCRNALTRGSSSRGAISAPSSRPTAWPKLMQPPSLPLLLQAFKGFGASNKNVEADERRGARGKKVKRTKQRDPAPLPGQGQDINPEFQNVVDLEARLQKKKDDIDFDSRLALLRADTRAKVAEVATSLPKPTQPVAAFDAPADLSSYPSIYDSPPALTKTLFGDIGGDISDPKLKNANIGPSQIGLAAGSLILAVVILISTGSDSGSSSGSKRYKGLQPSQAPPDAIEQGAIQQRISRLSEKFEANPKDAESLKGIAVSYAKLFNFGAAAGLLDSLVELTPDDSEAWRLLGETSLLSQKPARSIEAYEKVIALGNADLQVITGLVDARIANREQSKAVDFLKSSLDEMSKGDGGKVDEVKRGPRRYDDASLELLLAKTYNAWNGHDMDTESTYSSVVAKHPEDFRGYLARGVYLKENGRRTEADKMFMQAKFYAPESRQAFVKRLTADNPLLDVPGSD